MRRILTLTCLVALSASLGCGLEYTDTRARYRPTTDLDHGINVEPDKFVCPNMVLLREGGKGELTELRRGQVQDAFGPFVPCNTVLDSSDGTCTNADCAQTYSKDSSEIQPLSPEDVRDEARRAVAARIAGRTPSSKDAKAVAVAPVPGFMCPYEDCKKVISIGSGALERETGKNATIGDSYCYHCKRYVAFVANDISASVNHKEELVCPKCNEAIDSSLKVCRNTGCSLKGKLLNTNPSEGPCWSCGAIAHCPNCLGSGTGTVGAFDTTGWKEAYPNIKETKTPEKCYYCEGSGLCPECEGDGFILYEPSLPLDFHLHKGRGDSLEVITATKRSWQHPQPSKSDAEEGGE